jgi:hypothetical protein
MVVRAVPGAIISASPPQLSSLVDFGASRIGVLVGPFLDLETDRGSFEKFTVQKVIVYPGYKVCGPAKSNPAAMRCDVPRGAIRARRKARGSLRRQLRGQGLASERVVPCFLFISGFDISFSMLWNAFVPVAFRAIYILGRNSP